MQTATETRQQILMLKQLPPLSGTAARLLQMLSDENLSLTGLAEVIGQDPIVTARILGVANSAYFGQTTPIHTVEDAVIRVLGLNMVKSLAFSIAISGVFNTAKCPSFDLEAYWFRALTTAILSREICRQVTVSEQPDLDEVYLGGLLSDIGTLVLVHLFPDDYARVIHQLSETPTQNPHQVEEAIVGVSSQRAGALLTDRWHLPTAVVRVVAHSSMESARCEVAAVDLAVDLLRVRQRLESELPEVPAELSGLTREMLATIEAQSRLRDDEMRTIAGVMVR